MTGDLRRIYKEELNDLYPYQSNQEDCDGWGRYYVWEKGGTYRVLVGRLEEEEL